VGWNSPFTIQGVMNMTDAIDRGRGELAGPDYPDLIARCHG
jgi:hypothetical protein